MDQQPHRKPLPVGIDDFKKLIEGGYAFVDKSLFIKELRDARVEVALIPRMRRFGKTLNLSMVRYFFEQGDSSNAHLFEGLAIQQYPDIMAEQGTYPVISLTLKGIKAPTWDDAYRAFQLLIADEFRRHRYLLEGTLLDATEKRDYEQIISREAPKQVYEASLKHLAQWLTSYHKRPPILLIDEYDTPVHEAYLKDYYTQAIEFMRNWVGEVLKGGSIAWSVVTGILRVAGESMFSGPNNATPFTILMPDFSRCFGLLEHEVQQLLATYDLAHRHDAIRTWYDGYAVGDQTAVYNPWSVLQCLRSQGVIDIYWANTGDPALIQRLIAKGPRMIREGFEQLMSGGTITTVIPQGLTFSTFERDSEAIWALLLYAGYLTPVTMPESPLLPCTLRIPNEEVRTIYTTVVKGWFSQYKISDQYIDLLRALTRGDLKLFTTRLQQAFLATWSTYDVTPEEPECAYHTFMLGMLAWLDGYHVRSNRESGYGRYDIMLIPRDHTALGVVLELKVADADDDVALQKAADAALKQVEERQYAQELRAQGVTRIAYFGMAFCGKKVCIRHTELNDVS